MNKENLGGHTWKSKGEPGKDLGRGEALGKWPRLGFMWRKGG